MANSLIKMVWTDPKGQKPSVEKNVDAETAVNLLTKRGMSKGWAFGDSNLELVQDPKGGYSINKKKQGN